MHLLEPIFRNSEMSQLKIQRDREERVVVLHAERSMTSMTEGDSEVLTFQIQI